MTPKFSINALLLVASVTLTSNFAMGEDFPKRKAGLWELTTTSDDGGSPQVMQNCVDDKTEDWLKEVSMGMGKQMCSKHEIKKTSNGYETSVECAVMGMKVAGSSVVSGDFQNSYTIVSKSKFTPAMMGKSESTSNIEAKYLGACKADQKPGDMIFPDGKKMNMEMLKDVADAMNKELQKLGK